VNAATGERPGLQRERTVLAWDRTALSLALVGLLLVRSGGPPYLRPAHLIGLGLTVLGGVLLVVSRRRAAALAVPDDDVTPATRIVQLLAAAVVVGGGGALVTIGLNAG